MELVIKNQEKFDNRPLLPLDIKTKWLEALRSGKYNKGKHLLLHNDEYCCLGVLCEIQERPKIHKGNRLFSFDGSSTKLVSENPLFEILGSYGHFKGFVINHNHHYINLANINSYSEKFDEVIEIIEKYF